MRMKMINQQQQEKQEIRQQLEREQQVELLVEQMPKVVKKSEFSSKFYFNYKHDPFWYYLY